VARELLVTLAPQEAGQPAAGYRASPVHPEEREQRLWFRAEAPRGRAIGDVELEAPEQLHSEHGKKPDMSIKSRLTEF
jgi:hypothetical protein